MNLQSQALARLLWTLLAVLAVSGEPESSQKTSGVAASSLKDHRTGKYLELEDLNSAQRSFARETGLVKVDDERLVKRATNATTSKRPNRQQVKKPRPGFFWTLASVTYETFNDTRSAIQQIGEILNNSISPEPKKTPPKKKPAKQPLTKVTTTTVGPETTTQFKLTRPLLQSLVRRNVKGLVRLFNIEWRDAMQQSKKNAADFQRDLGKQVGIYLQDNPNVY